MRLAFLPKPKRPQPSFLCVPSSYCLECPIELREAVCFFKRPKPTPRSSGPSLFAIFA